MAIDMRQFHQTFFEESLEGLANMETGALQQAPICNLEHTVIPGEYPSVVTTERR